LGANNFDNVIVEFYCFGSFYPSFSTFYVSYCPNYANYLDISSGLFLFDIMINPGENNQYI